ncbi:MAG: asparagine synthase (glutamine-hydrolyzing) [Bacteroidetes bacterium]|nr:asparagine synthase (glutamine-hydrolyzing) [Bacteroidota bacterium]
MCGIVGIFEKSIDNSHLISKMLELIEHRGPDDSSVFTSGNYTFGHRRLSIIDLNTGNQPIFNEDKSLCVIFNGEIYNYKEIKIELQKFGHIFKTEADTEILVHGFEQYGANLFRKLNGIFAFALLDINNGSLYLVRDQFGIKPLHYYFKNDVFIFASEQKAILLHNNVERKLNPASLHSHLNLRYTQRDETLFANIMRIPPAHYLVFDGSDIQLNKYWQLSPQINPAMNEGDAIDEMHFHIKNAVKRQLMSDVPLGVYLSGGMDSSTIVQKMHELDVKEINTFTLGFNEPTDEFEDAKYIADHFQTNHRTLSLSMDPLIHLPEVIWHAEEPKINLLQGFNMSKFVSNHVKVVLGGLGGDELFAGYDIHKFIFPFNKWHNRIPKGFKKILEWKSDWIFKIQNASHTLGLDEYRRGIQMLMAIGDIEKFYLILRNEWDFDNGFYNEIYNPQTADKLRNQYSKANTEFDKYFSESINLSSLDQVLYTEFHTKMVNDYLLVEDRMSMAHSVEERVPFLDIDLVNFGFTIPVHLKIKNNQTKYLFRKAMSQKLPEQIVRKKKWGFTINPYLQFKKDLKAVAENILTKEFVEQQGLFNYEYIKRILDYPPSPRLRWHYNYLWILVGLAVWQKMYIDSSNFSERKFSLEDYYSR